MPTARGMRRSTRVFGMVKGADGARVLRSGRRLWPDSENGKIGKINDGEDWYKMMNNFRGDFNYQENKLTGSDSKRSVTAMEVNARPATPKPKKLSPSGLSVPCDKKVNANKMFGSVYTRKRKEIEPSSHEPKLMDCIGTEQIRNNSMVSNSSIELEEKKKGPCDRMCGLHYVRRKRARTEPVSFSGQRSRMLVVAVEFSCSNALWFSDFLNLVFTHFTKARIKLKELFSFVFSESITRTFSSCGVYFFEDVPCSSSYGICKIFGTKHRIPFFTVGFAALPLCFLFMHSTMLLRSERLVYVLQTGISTQDNDSDSDDDVLSCVPSSRPIDYVAPVDNIFINEVVTQQTVRSKKRTLRNSPYRNGMNTRSIICGKRRSMRSRIARKTTLVGTKAFKGSFSPNLLCLGNELIPFEKTVSNRSAASNGNLVKNIKDMNITSCSANILVFESDRCYREEGVNIQLELSPSSNGDDNQWFLVVKRDGLMRYSYKAENVMRPCGSNRFTHSIIWTPLEDSWKLEFPNRMDWAIFKELYKECLEKNISEATEVKVIPIPGVVEVSGYEDGDHGAHFVRPESYITLDSDELSRALGKTCSNYDMDYEDEVWLNKLINEMAPVEDNELYENINEENFELMIDTFEKSLFRGIDDFLDEKRAISLFPNLGSREAVQAVYNYWMNKRKTKRSALVRVFQAYQPRISQLKDSVLRKKRSFKRQASQSGRGGKQRSILQESMDAKKHEMEEINANLRAEEAKAAANLSAETAIKKRKTAQLLMQIADLSAYRATIACRIAEASLITGSSDAASLTYLD